MSKMFKEEIKHKIRYTHLQPLINEYNPVNGFGLRIENTKGRQLMLWAMTNKFVIYKKKI